MSEHPSKDIKGSLSHKLEGKRIVLCLSGSVAAVRSSEVARLLMRHGAEVFPVFSEAATRLIHPDLMEWATGNKPVTELTGEIEHVALAGNVTNTADLILLAPATANTIGKVAAGIDDTPVTTVITTGLGQGIPLIVVPAMHEPMYRHPFVKENIRRLKDAGITVMMPRVEEGKAKIPENEEILARVMAILGGASGPLAGKKVLITAGRTVEYLDPVRVITNNSTGKMGIALAAAAKALGAEVVLVYGKGSAVPPDGVRVISVDTCDQMYRAVEAELKKNRIDVAVATAAVGDWKPVAMSERKISTHTSERLVLEMVPTPKILDRIKGWSPETFLVAFRAQANLSREELLEDGFQRLQKAKADLIAINDTSAPGRGFEGDTNELFVLDKNNKLTPIPLAGKAEVAERLMALIGEALSK